MEIRVWRFQNYRDCGYTCNPHKFEIPALQFPCKVPVIPCKHLQCTTTTYIHTTKDSLAPLFYLQQCSSRWANPPCYRVIELLMDFVSSYQKEIRQIFPIKQKYYQTAGFWVLLHSHLNSLRQKGWDGCELLVLTFLKSAFE